jgi:hypothetical protein
MPMLWEDRYTAIHLLRAGHSVEQVAKQLKRPPRVGTQMAQAIRD